MSTVGQLQPGISPGYGFTAIIVAFLGRLNPVGALVAAFALAISYLGGEVLIRYRVRWSRDRPAPTVEEAPPASAEAAP